MMVRITDVLGRLEAGDRVAGLDAILQRTETVSWYVNEADIMVIAPVQEYETEFCAVNLASKHIAIIVRGTAETTAASVNAQVKYP